MSRRRYISTEISVDAKLNRVSDFAALFYTWSIPHARDDCRISPQNAEELLLRVVPGRKKTPEQVQKAIDELLSAGLIGSDENGEIFFPANSFYKFQTYINAANRRETPQNAVSSSLSLSPSIKEDKEKSRTAANAARLGWFEVFWKEYPKKEKKRDALKSWDNIPALTEDLSEEILDALRRHKTQERWIKDNGQYIPYPSTWLNGRRWEDEIHEGEVEETREQLLARQQYIQDVADGKYKHD